LKNVYEGNLDSINDMNFKNMLDESFIKMCAEAYEIHEKCKKVLFEYIKDRLQYNQFIEFFSSWDGEEGLDRDQSLDTIVYLYNLHDSSQVKIHDRQYIRFYLASN
jgi:hypothetical protein